MQCMHRSSVQKKARTGGRTYMFDLKGQTPEPYVANSCQPSQLLHGVRPFRNEMTEDTIRPIATPTARHLSANDSQPGHRFYLVAMQQFWFVHLA
jgi:hypothetical protein